MASIYETNNQTQIVIIPNPGMGHLIPLVELARHLLLQNPSLFFTFILVPGTVDATPSPTPTPPALSLLHPNVFDVVNLPPPSFPTFSDAADEMFTRVMQSINRSLPLLRQTLEEITHDRPVKALIIDAFATDMIHVGLELGIKCFVFYAASAISLSMSLHLPKQIEEHEEWDPDEPLSFPGCPTLHVKDLPDILHNRSHSNTYAEWFLDHCKRLHSSDAIILNSLQGLEEEPIRALTEATVPPVHVVGPLVRAGSQIRDPSIIRWLDEQPVGSVLYVNFGSGGTLSTNQVGELAMGLELSQQSFLWVVRRPNDSVPYGTFLSQRQQEDSDGPLGFLPQGFVERTQGRGLVLHSWAPQAEILGHGSTGGFLTHCGWNSILEGVVSGVGFIAWPLYAEQRMNALELVEKAKVALPVVDRNKDGVVGRDDIAKVVNQLMVGREGMEIKQRMNKLKDEARRRMDNGGTSNLTLSLLAPKITPSAT